MPSRFLLFKGFLLPLAAALAWHQGGLALLPLSLFLPWCLGWSRSRRESFFMALLYFAVVWFPCIPGARIFFGEDTYFGGIVLWLAGTMLCSLPFFLWRVHRAKQSLCVVLALSLHALLPIGLGSPLLSAGALYPGFGWGGLVAVLVLCGALANRSWPTVTILLGVAVFCQRGQTMPPVPSDWERRETHWSLRPATPLTDWQHGQEMFAQAERSSKRVFVYPETILTSWSDQVGTAFFASDLAFLREQGKTVLFGAETEGPIRDNVLWARGAERAEYRQRIPVPVAMWGRNVRSHLTGPGLIQVQGKRVAVLLCYEQLLILPALQSFASQPDLLLSISNLYWARGTSIGDTESMCVRAWSRLFSVPSLEARNW